MKKRIRVLIPAFALLLTGCSLKDVNEAVINWTNNNMLETVYKVLPGLEGSTHLNFDEGKSLDQTHQKGALGDFNLLTPATGAIVDNEPTFSWSESTNAVYYNLEVCSSNTFDKTSSSIVYTQETNISSTSFKLSASLKQKNVTYYWRVTAVNEYNSKAVGKEKVSEVKSFFYHVEGTGEIPIEVGEAGDWQLHKVGSYADISIDHNDFFGTGDQDSLMISFEKEHTSQGEITSIGWLDVQKAVEQDFYGTDAFYCNFYFMGHDSRILIRIIDQDGELWYKQVKFSMDAKQVALLKFSEFTLRTRDTIVQNEVFNYEHIQAIEVCFEQTFGDGCCIIGGMKCVNYAAYSEMFIQKLNFNMIPLSEWIVESYDFAETISEDGSELTLEYSTTAGFNGNEKGMGSYGYGFSKIPLKRYFSDGNAVRVKIKTTGSVGNANAIIRIYEPDKDRWSFTQPYSSLNVGEFTEFTIPFMAFDQSSIVEGKRQFYYIENIQFGLNNCYGSGTITYKDFEIITLPSVSTNPIIVKNDGIIENFDEYNYRTEAYEHWETSVDNKDEGIFLASDERYHDATNKFAGKFTYKADMSMATYDVYTDVKAQGMNAIKFWIKDASILNIPDNAPQAIRDLTVDDISAKVVLQIALKDGRWYRYVIDQAPRRWTEYTIPFSAFSIYQGIELDTSIPKESQNVVNFAFGLQYFYMNGPIGYPLYTQNNPVFMDNIMFTTATESKIEALEMELHPDATTKVTLVDDFEYDSDTSLANHWFGLNKHDYEHLELSNEVSSEGGSHSMKLDYKGANSPSYATYPTVGSDVTCKAISIDIKGDGVATIYLNFYIRAGSTLHQYRHTISNPATGWNRYVIGFGTANFQALTSGAQALGQSSMQNLARLTFGIVNNASNDLSSIYVDNVRFLLNDVAYGTKTVTALS